MILRLSKIGLECDQEIPCLTVQLSTFNIRVAFPEVGETIELPNARHPLQYLWKGELWDWVTIEDDY